MVPLGAVDVDALTSEKRAVDTADSLDEKKTILIEVRDHKAKLVDMTGQHDMRPFLRPAQPGKGVPVSVGRELVAMRFDVVRPHALRTRLEAGG
jgi:hypothetical protein